MRCVTDFTSPYSSWLRPKHKIPVWSIPGVTCAATVGHLIRNTHKCPIPPLRNECTHRTVAVRTVSTKPLLRHMSNNAGYAECSLTDFLSTMCYCLTKLKIFEHTCSNKISGGEKPPMTQEQIEAIEKDAAARLALHKNPYFDKYADQINKMQR